MWRAQPDGEYCQPVSEPVAVDVTVPNPEPVAIAPTHAHANRTP